MESREKEEQARRSTPIRTNLTTDEFCELIPTYSKRYYGHDWLDLKQLIECFHPDIKLVTVTNFSDRLTRYEKLLITEEFLCLGITLQQNGFA